VFPDARVGVLAMDNVTNPPTHPALEQQIREVEAELRQEFAGADRAVLSALPVMQAYQRHYRKFGQTYHVLRQLESVALKGKTPTSRGALVQAMFATELRTRLLTAGHDLDAVQPPLEIDASTSEDRFTGIGGQEHLLRPGDMLMRDVLGIISAVVYGPDQRTRLNEHTRRVLFTTYAPRGIDPDDVTRHLSEIASLVSLATPGATVQMLAVYPSG
jgi:DNA/RNA-binding domain of Phe-tRNA-synthetase-like protein